MLLVGFATFGSIGFSQSLTALLWMAIILCSLIGIIRREPVFDSTLNHWDEAAAYGALLALAIIFNSIAAA
ncbi:hypothetical protein [Bradyrhizobium sp. Ec3.3]|uniref:hypothetical protein n=1 Tax=Bradyrhizobium sp. Ec3.3 TaxID=189753 RepID=UPI0003F59569|nr:hypothetical protein [Bradyrhizobium sp. Ec3.3]